MLEVLIALFLLAWGFNKVVTNQDPERTEAEEERDLKGASKHQFWQTMDYTEPWNKK